MARTATKPYIKLEVIVHRVEDGLIRKQLSDIIFGHESTSVDNNYGVAYQYEPHNRNYTTTFGRSCTIMIRIIYNVSRYGKKEVV